MVKKPLLPTEPRVIVVFGRVVTLETLKRNCVLHHHPELYAVTLWRSYWIKRDTGQDRTNALNEIVRISFTETEQKKLFGKPFDD